MKNAISLVFLTAIIIECAAFLSAEEQSLATDERKARALQAVMKILKGEPLTSPDLVSLRQATVQIEELQPAPGLRIDRGIENAELPDLAVGRDIGIYRYNTGKSDDKDIEMLKMQAEILQGQIGLLRSVGALVAHNAILGARSGRIESGMRDMTSSMKSDARELQKVRGEAAATNGRVTELGEDTTDMAQVIQKMSKSIEELEHNSKDMEIEIGELRQ